MNVNRLNRFANELAHHFPPYHIVIASVPIGSGAITLYGINDKRTALQHGTVLRYFFGIILQW